MRAHRIILVLILNYILIILVCAFSEQFFLMNKSQHIQLMVRTAADMALEQTQATDDFFIKGRGYATDADESFTIMMARNGRFESVQMYTGMFGESNPNSKELIFNRLFVNSDFSTLANKLGNIRTSVSYWNQEKTGIAWYKIARVAQVGLPATGYGLNVTSVTDPSGAPVNQSLANEILHYYKFNQTKRLGYANGGYMDYFVTPISLGLTYLNPDALNTLFLNNLDLLMRSKYHDNGYNLETPEGGNGVLMGTTYTDKVDTSINTYNPINDGVFTLVRGLVKEDNNGFKTYQGIPPKIEYKVIDMYDPDNDNILKMIFGANTTNTNTGVVYPTKAAYLKSLDDNLIDPATRAPYTSKPFVVAKVTFYADIIVPYTTFPIRDFRGNLDPLQGNYLDLVRDNSTGIKGVTNNDVFSYTRYFAVAP